ncbi:hypothetical protein [Mariniflexile sp.]|uniref:hypothetical protein n=1 Tax=Mariniflexile sp. TaxID=1979402 RepID=UPI00356B4FAA
MTSCKKDDDINTDNNPDINEELIYNEITVEIPTDASVSFSDLTVIGNLNEFKIPSNGVVSIPHTNDSRSLAILVNQNKEPVLIGFIHQNNLKISISSTIEALYYYGLGTYFLDEDVKDEYFKQSLSIKDFDKTVTEFKEAFKQNTNFLNSPDFFSWFEEKLNLIRDDDIKNLALRSVLVDANDIKSGIQIFEDTGLNIKIANEYRRRAHAFLYKTKVKHFDKSEEVLISNIASSKISSNADTKIKSIQAKREFLGVIGDWASGVGVEFFRSETDPIPLQLNDNEEYAIYKVRVLGPAIGVIDKSKFNSVEKQKLEEIIIETLAMDFVLPFFLDVIGEAKLLKGLDEVYFKEFTSLINAVSNSVPSMADAIEKGDFKTATSEFFKAFYNNSIGESRSKIIEALRDGVINYKMQISKGDNLAILGDAQDAVNKFNGANKYLDWTDKILKLSDYASLASGIAKSKYLEEWEVKAKQDPVTLNPQEPTAFPFIKTYVEAIVKNKSLASGESYAYEWQVSGNYGKIFDAKGHEGVNFESSDKEIYYLSDVDDNNLPEDAQETLVAKVYVKKGQEKTFVGTDTITIKVEPYKYLLKPDGATVNGNSSIELKLLRVDFSEDINDNNLIDYKIVWKTTGNYGTFSGGDLTTTTYNSNAITYKALDEDVEHGIETISAFLYGKVKSEPNADYKLYDEISGIVNIKNEVDKIYKIVPASVVVWGPTTTGGYINCGNYVTFLVKPVENAIKYEASIIEYSLSSSAIGRTTSWGPNSPLEDGNFEIFKAISYRSKSSPVNHFTGCPDVISVKGAMQVVITIKK